MEMEPKFQVFNLIYGFINSNTLKCALQLGLPDLLKKHGQPMSLTEIIDGIPGRILDPDRMYRLMRLLVHNNIFTCSTVNGSELKYGLTPLSELLVTKDEKSLAMFAFYALHPFSVESSQHFIEGLDGLERAWVNGQEVTWDEMVANYSDLQEVGDKGLTSYTSLMVDALVSGCARENVFDSVHSIVDLAGGKGTSSKAIVEAFPEIKCTVVDIPGVINGPHFTHPRIDYQAGDAFSFVPKADVIFIKSFFHDFPDEACIEVLKKCKEAIPPKTGKVLLIEMVIEEKGSSKNLLSKLYMDMDMMIIGGKERSRKNWEEMFDKAGFNHRKFIDIDALESIIEVRP